MGKENIFVRVHRLPRRPGLKPRVVKLDWTANIVSNRLHYDILQSVLLQRRQELKEYVWVCGLVHRKALCEQKESNVVNVYMKGSRDMGKNMRWEQLV